MSPINDHWLKKFNQSGRNVWRLARRKQTAKVRRRLSYWSRAEHSAYRRVIGVALQWAINTFPDQA